MAEAGQTATSDGGAPATPPKSYRFSIFPKDVDIEPDFAEGILDLEKALGRPIWVLIQSGGTSQWGMISQTVYGAFREQKAAIPEQKPVGLLIHSPGGDADSAYQIVRLFQRRTLDFSTIVPLYAKSAATLIAIGGKEIVMGSEAELGPLDVQLYDEDQETWDSALNAVQSFERLNAYALMAYDQAMQLFLSRTVKRANALMPYALQYATSVIGPLADKIDTLELTRKSRELKVAEDYAVRVMKWFYPERDFTRIARGLVERYSSHGFVIDRTEAAAQTGGPAFQSPLNLGLHISKYQKEIDEILTKLVPHLERATFIGRVMERTP